MVVACSGVAARTRTPGNLSDYVAELQSHSFILHTAADVKTRLWRRVSVKTKSPNLDGIIGV